MAAAEPLIRTQHLRLHHGYRTHSGARTSYSVWMQASCSTHWFIMTLKEAQLQIKLSLSISNARDVCRSFEWSILSSDQPLQAEKFLP